MIIYHVINALMRTETERLSAENKWTNGQRGRIQ